MRSFILWRTRFQGVFKGSRIDRGVEPLHLTPGTIKRSLDIPGKSKHGEAQINAEPYLRRLSDLSIRNFIMEPANPAQFQLPFRNRPLTRKLASVRLSELYDEGCARKLID